MTADTHSSDDESRPPVLVTFYSFKGGVGRTQALANVAMRLATFRRTVLMVDVDLEAPGLSIGLLDERTRSAKDGFAEIAADLIADLEAVVSSDAEEADEAYARSLFETYLDRATRALHVLDTPRSDEREALIERLSETFPDVDAPAALALLASGRLDPTYACAMVRVPLAEAFSQPVQPDRAAAFLAALGLSVQIGERSTVGHVFTVVFREVLRRVPAPETGRPFDYVLLDSRSGLADVGGLCVRGLPDVRVVLSGLNRQNLEGTRMVLGTLDDDDRRSDRLLVVFSPVPEGEIDLLEDRLEKAARKLDVAVDEVQTLHYHPRIALEEEPFIRPVHRLTRVYQEYEDLTARLRRLAGGDFQSRLNDAFRRLREEGDNASFVRDLVGLAVLNPDQVLTLVEGSTTQLNQREDADPKAADFFRLRVALAPDSIEALSMAATYIARLAKHTWAGDSVEAKRLFEEAFGLYKRIFDINPKEYSAWNNWGNDLAELAQHLWDAGDQEGAAVRYETSFEKFARVVEVKPDLYEAWYNWGLYLSKLAQRLWDAGDREEAVRRYETSFEKFARAVEIKPDKDKAWDNWGTVLLHRAQRTTGEGADRFLEAAEEKLLRAEAIRAGSGAYNLACVHAVRGDDEGARRWLEQARTHGTLPGLAHLQADADLDSLRDKPWFQEFLATLEEDVAGAGS